MTPASGPAPLATGEALGEGYAVCEHLNRGVTLDVYSVWSRERDCLCIAKALRPDRVEEDGPRRRLLHEGHMLIRLNHPHLVPGYDVLHTQHGPVVVLQTLTGSTLSHLIESQGSTGLDNDDVTILGRQLCSVLHYLHGYGQLHLDLKPSNIVCTAGAAVLLDLSLAQPPGPCTAGAGTAEYMAPEQLAGTHVDTPADVWGLGGVLYRSLTGRRPLPHEGRDADTLPDMEPLHQPAVSSTLTTVVTECLRLDPTTRPTLDQMRDRLDRAGATAPDLVASGP